MAEGTFTGRQAEAALHRLVLDCCVDDLVLQYLLPDGVPHGWESSLWDYKRELPSTSGRERGLDSAANAEGILELIKDVVAFHNAYGGYILSGVDQFGQSQLIGCSNLNSDGFTVEKLNEQLFAYTRRKISCRFRKVRLTDGIDGGLLLVPMRSTADPIVSFIKGAPDTPPRKPVFRKGDIYARIDDQCLPVHEDVQSIQFLCSSRSLDPIGSGVLLENTLPIQDPNLIRFVGRSGYLLSLWSWMTERHAPVKVLTALGGTGKTAIAYEFARQVIASPPAWMQKLIWLTAKKQAFSAVLGQWVPVTRTDFGTVEGFCAALARELGATEEELKQADDRESLLDLVLEGLQEFPALVVVDDVDSLAIEAQADLFSTIQIIAGRTFDRGSRFLLTSRLELGSGDPQRIPVKGFGEGEFSEFANMVAQERGLRLNDGELRRLHTASLGSPIFCASILRLVSLGAELNAAINQWRGKEGEMVRRFAFARELEQLSDSQACTLFALCVLGETTQLELTQVLNEDDTQIARDLARLREYHLFAVSGNPSTGAKLETPEPLRLMTDVLRLRITDPSRIENECARARRNVPRLQSKAATAIASVLALWKADDYEAALLAAEQAKKQSASNADVHCILGQSYLKVTPAKAEHADRAFRQAKTLGCQRPELLPNWLRAKQLKRDWAGIIDLHNTLPPTEFRGGSVTIVLNALLETSRQQIGRQDYVRGADTLKGAMSASSAAISQQRVADQISMVRQQCREAARQYVQLRSHTNPRPADRLAVFNAVMDAFVAHVTETWMIELALESLSTWASEAFGRLGDKHDVRQILNLRLEDIVRLRRHLEESEWSRDLLVQKVRTTELQLRRYLG